MCLGFKARNRPVWGSCPHLHRGGTPPEMARSGPARARSSGGMAAGVCIHIHTSHGKPCTQSCHRRVTHMCLCLCAFSQEMTNSYVPTPPRLTFTRTVHALHVCFYTQVHLARTHSFTPVRVSPPILGRACAPPCTHSCSPLCAHVLPGSACSGAGSLFLSPRFVQEWFLSIYYIPGCVLDARDRGEED